MFLLGEATKASDSFVHRDLLTVLVYGPLFLQLFGPL